MRRVDQAGLMAAGNDLNATVRNGGRIQRRPNRDEWIMIEVDPPILMPGQPRALVGGLVHEHGAEGRCRRVRSIDPREISRKTGRCMYARKNESNSKSWIFR